MSFSYNIERWDGVLDSYIKAPMIYVRLDDTKLKDSNVVGCEISGTNTPYDGQKVLGVLRPSINDPSYRPNFYDATKLYVITLNAQWNGYPCPDKLGRVKITPFN